MSYFFQHCIVNSAIKISYNDCDCVIPVRLIAIDWYTSVLSSYSILSAIGSQCRSISAAVTRSLTYQLMSWSYCVVFECVDYTVRLVGRAGEPDRWRSDVPCGLQIHPGISAWETARQLPARCRHQVGWLSHCTLSVLCPDNLTPTITMIHCVSIKCSPFLFLL